MQKLRNYLIPLLLILAMSRAIFAAGDPIATAFNISAIQGVPKVIQLQGAQVDGHSLTFAVSSGPSHGAISQLNVSSGVLIYTATSSYTGTDSFNYTVASTDTSGTPSTSSAATVTITVVSSQRTHVVGTLNNPGGGVRVGTVTWVLSTAATTGAGVQIPAGSSISAVLDSSGSYAVDLYPTDSMFPLSYYQLIFQDLNGRNRQQLGLYSIPTATSINQAILDANIVTDFNLAKRYLFASETSIEALTAAVIAGGGVSHNLLDAHVSDTTAASVQRGDIVTGQGGTPKWTRLALGLTGKVVQSNGTDILEDYITVSNIAAGNLTGNGTKFVTSTGSQTSGNLVSIDSNGNHVASGIALSGLPSLSGTNSWSGANTFAGATNINGGGALVGTFTGAPTFDGQNITNIIGSTATPYDIPVQSLSGRTSPSQKILMFVAVRNFTLTFTGSNCAAETAAAAQTDFAVYVGTATSNGTQKATLRFAAAGNVCSVVTPTSTAIVAGDVIRIIGPGTPDTALANLTFSLRNLSTELSIYDIPGMNIGVTTANQRIIFHSAARPFVLTITGSNCAAETAATAQTDFGIYVGTATSIGTLKGTLRFAASGTTCSVVSPVVTSIAVGDIVRLVGPLIPDITLANFTVTLKANLP